MGEKIKIDIDTIVKQLENEKSKDEIKKKPLSEFRNSHKNFQYDYEEDPYEPYIDPNLYDDY